MIQYTKYNNQLKAESGIDFTHYMQALRNVGNETGIYADVALLLYRLVAHSHTKSVLEFGSGMSTCVLAKAVQGTDKEFHAMEHLQKWYEITCRCISSLGLQAPGFVCTYSDPSKFSEVVRSVDVAWVDGPIAHKGVDGLTLGRVESCEWYADKLRDAVLLFDDAQSMPDIIPWVRSFGRPESGDVWFNPTGRKDRHVFISFPSTEHPLWSVVESCNLGGK